MPNGAKNGSCGTTFGTVGRTITKDTDTDDGSDNDNSIYLWTTWRQLTTFVGIAI
jgi:hypothetical protein